MAGYKDPEYQRNRKSILAGSPLCHWCGQAKATQADHLIELDAGGDHSITNLVPSCASCNARRGTRYLNRKVADRIKARNAFLDGKRFTPSPHFQILSEGPDGAGSAPMQEYRSLEGRTEPRLVTPVPTDRSLGPAQAEWAKQRMKIDLMPWQVRAISDQLALDDDDNFVFREALISTGRQNGKSFALKSMMAWWVTEEAKRRKEPQHVLLVANKLERSMPMYREVALWLEEHYGATCRWAAGSQMTTMPDGSTVRVAAARDNTHGLTLDLILIDEVWDIAPSVVFDALRPSMIARKNPLLSMWSTAGDESSATMLRLREQAINSIDAGKPSRLYLAEWSMPPSVDPDDRRYWPYANPALGTTITWEALEAQADGGDRSAFLRAHLNLWVSAAKSWMPIGLWETRAHTDPIPEGGILAVDSSIDDSRYVGVRASQGPDGVQVHVEFVVEKEDAMWAEIERIMADPKIQLAITPGLEIHTPLPLRRRTETVGYGELARYTTMVRSMIIEGKLWHDGSVALAEHVQRAVLVKTQASQVVSSQKSPGPIELCRCMIWAAA
ncbi:MAG: HNH endonuclease, partial [Pontimonas sp.]